MVKVSLKGEIREFENGLTVAVRTRSYSFMSFR